MNLARLSAFGLPALAGLLCAPNASAQASSFLVNSTADTPDANPGDGIAADAGGTTTLRAAIQEANAIGGAALIRLDLQSNYTLTMAGAGEDLCATGDLDITANITLDGALSTLNAAGMDRAFDVHPGGRLYCVDLTITGGAVFGESGGAIRNQGNTSLIRSTVTNCSATGDGASGGALFNDGGFLMVEECTLSMNDAERAGGAVEANAGTTLIDDSELSNNTTGPGPGNGGALHLTGAGSVDVRDSTISGNSASREGGGLWNSGSGTMTVDNCVVTLNAANGTAADDGGGGVFNDGGVLVLGWSSIANNTATQGSGSGGGLFNNAGTAFVLTTDLNQNISNRAGGGVEIIAGVTEFSGSSLAGNSTGASPGNGGGLHLTGAGIVNFDRSRAVANSASAEGGGLWNSAVGTMSISNSVISNNVASGNDADQGGGGLFNDGGTLTVRNSNVNRNVADGTSGSGGGVLNNLGTLMIDSTRVLSNRSQRAGGGVEANVGTTTLVNVALSNNSTGSAPGNGGGLHLTGAGSVTIDVSRVDLNTASAEGGGLWNSATGTMVVTGTAVNNNTAPIGPDVFNDGGTFTVDGVPVAPGP